MGLSREELLRVAKLSAMEIGEDEVDSFAGDLRAILGFVAQLDEVDTSSVEETSHVHGVVNVFREDLVVGHMPTELALSNAPELHKSSFKVPRVI